MANDAISQLPPVISLSGAEYLPVVQGGVTKRATLTQVGGLYLLADNNLSDLDSVSTALTNLGLGTGDTPTFNGLDLNSGAVINWASGDVTLTHASNTLTFAGGTAYTFNSGTFTIAKNIFGTGLLTEWTGGPQYVLQVNQSNTASNYSLLYAAYGANAYGTNTEVIKSRSLDGTTHATVANADRIYSIEAGVDDGTTLLSSGILELFVDGAVSTGVIPTAWQLWSSNAAGTHGVSLKIDTSRNLLPGANDGGALGKSTNMWSDLFLASGGVINFNAGDMTITHSVDTLTFAGSSSATNSLTYTQTDAFGYSDLAINSDPTKGGYFRYEPTAGTGAAWHFTGGFSGRGRATDGTLKVSFTLDSYIRDPSPSTWSTDVYFSWKTNNATKYVEMYGTALSCYSNDAVSLGYSGVGWSDLFLASGAVINFNSGDVTLTHSANLLAVAGGQITFAATATGFASFNLPTGTAPSAPVDGDVWREDNTNTGLKIRVNGVTKTITLS